MYLSMKALPYPSLYILWLFISCSSSFPGDLVKLNIQTPMYRIVKAVAAKDSGLEVKDRTWLKMTIPNSFIGGCKPYLTPSIHTSLLCLLSSIPSSCLTLYHSLSPCSLSGPIVTVHISIGSELVDWLNSNVEGFQDRRHARKYAALMLKVYIHVHVCINVLTCPDVTTRRVILLHCNHWELHFLTINSHKNHEM